jgi:hypothetical protein
MAAGEEDVKLQYVIQLVGQSLRSQVDDRTHQYWSKAYPATTVPKHVDSYSYPAYSLRRSTSKTSDMDRLPLAGKLAMTSSTSSVLPELRQAPVRQGDWNTSKV